MCERLKLTATLAVVLFACACPASPQAVPAGKSAASTGDALPSVDQLVERCAKASGGKEAWAKLATLVLTGTIEVPAAGLTGKIEVFTKSPNKIFHVFSLADGQFIEKQGFDGRIGWKFDSQHGLKRLEGAELEEARLEGIFDSEVRLKEVYPDMKATGRAKVGDRDAYTVQAHKPSGKTATFYFDAQTGLRIAEDLEGPDENGKVEKSSAFFEEYRAVEGAQIPFRTRVTSPSFSLVINVQQEKHNVPLDDAMFAMPADSNPPAASSAQVERKSQDESTVLDPGTFSQDIYTNQFFGFRYEAPPGWTAHGDETKKEIMATGKSLIDQNTPAGKAIADRSSEKTHQLLTLFQYPLGTPVVENQLVQILAEDVRYAPGIRSGREYLLNVTRVLKIMKSVPEFDEEPKKITYGGQTMYRIDILTKHSTKATYQCMVATVSKGYAISFVFTSFSPEGRDKLVKTLDSLRFEAPENAANPH
jgi:hypothetical protein